MNIHVRALSFAACLTGLIGFADTASAAAVIRTQAPCAGSSGWCLQFNAGAVIPVIRSFAFNAPSAGTAAVSFHGSLVCSSNSSMDRVVDLVTQIVTSAGSAPNVDGPGALRLAEVLKDNSAEHILRTSDSFSLASTRVIAIPAAGVRYFYFKIASLRMDFTTYCRVYNAVFTVQFVP